jgi:hypothetical protein
LDTSWNGSGEQEAESLGLLEAVLHENEQEDATEYFDEAGWAVDDSGNECDAQASSDNTDEDKEDPRPGVAEPAVSKPVTALVAQRDNYLAALTDGSLWSFKCGCRRARDGNWSSCLDQFSKTELKAAFSDVHGPANGLCTRSDLLKEHHRLLWEQRVPLRTADRLDRQFQVPSLRMGQSAKEVCQRAFVKGLCLTPNGHQIQLALVLRGHGPGQVSSTKLAGKAVKSFKRQKQTKVEWASNWWCTHLRLHDYLPNENAIQIRGPPWQLVFEKQFEPMAKRAGMNCSRAQWMRSRPGARPIHPCPRLRARCILAVGAWLTLAPPSLVSAQPGWTC